ncbi:MAG: DUF2281 domain-containing protein [Methanolinea sp.]|nr:DUF2281 domain-containing protein [Methanolinea sp.]
MAPLDEKIARLPPDLRKEVEDYVDFLLERRVPLVPEPPGVATSPPDDQPLIPKPLILADEIPFRTDTGSIPLFPEPAPRNPAGAPREKVIEFSLPRQVRRSPGQENDILDWID